MRFHPKGGIEHRQYLRLKNVVASVRGFPRQGGLRVGQGKTCQTLIFSQCCANSVANKRNSIRKGRENSRPVNFGATTRRRLSAETCRFSNPTVGKSPLLLLIHGTRVRLNASAGGKWKADRVLQARRGSSLACGTYLEGRVKMTDANE